MYRLLNMLTVTDLIRTELNSELVESKVLLEFPFIHPPRSARVFYDVCTLKPWLSAMIFKGTGVYCHGEPRFLHMIIPLCVMLYVLPSKCEVLSLKHEEIKLIDDYNMASGLSLRDC